MTRFGELLERLKQALRERVRNGELTERGLARRVGLSQAHIHNVLNGKRILTSSVADRLMAELRLSLFDLLKADEFEKLFRRTCRGQACPGVVAAMCLRHRDARPPRGRSSGPDGHSLPN